MSKRQAKKIIRLKKKISRLHEEVAVLNELVNPPNTPAQEPTPSLGALSGAASYQQPSLVINGLLKGKTPFGDDQFVDGLQNGINKHLAELLARVKAI